MLDNINFRLIHRKNKTIAIYYINIIFLLFFNLHLIYCEDIQCKSDKSLQNKNCFNNLLIFNNKKYRAGHFATKKNGDLIIEFSEDNHRFNCSRLFYGLKRDGQYYFDNNMPTYELNITAEDAILPYGQLAGISTGGNDTNAVNTGNITINVQNPFTEAGRFQIAGIQAYSSTAKNCFNAGTITISDDILNDGLAHEFQVGEIGSSSTSSSSGNKWNTNPNSNALGCVTATGYSACTIEQSQAVGSYVNEEAPDILSIINGDDAFEIKDGDNLPTLKVFN